MSKRIACQSASWCVVLLMFGTSSIASDEASIAPDALPVQDGVAVASSGSAQVGPDCPDCESDAASSGAGFFGWGGGIRQFDLPSRSYSLFRSPASYGWGYAERCAPTPWRPRGNGIPRRTSCYRMDYRPYQLKSDYSVHGPAYYMRYELYPCEECHEHAIHLRRKYGYRPFDAKVVERQHP